MLAGPAPGPKPLPRRGLSLDVGVNGGHVGVDRRRWRRWPASVAAPITVPRDVVRLSMASSAPTCRSSAARGAARSSQKATRPMRVPGDLVLHEVLGRLLRGGQAVRADVGGAHRAGHVERQDDRRACSAGRPGRSAAAPSPTPSAAMAARNRPTGTWRRQRERRGRAWRMQGDAGVAHGLLAPPAQLPQVPAEQQGHQQELTPAASGDANDIATPACRTRPSRSAPPTRSSSVPTPAKSAVTSVFFGSVTVRRSMFL